MRSLGTTSAIAIIVSIADAGLLRLGGKSTLEVDFYLRQIETRFKDTFVSRKKLSERRLFGLEQPFGVNRTLSTRIAYIEDCHDRPSINPTKLV
jgi:hypothetical protein